MIAKIKALINKVLASEIMRYAISGGITTVVNLGLFYILLFCDIRYEIAHITGIISAKVLAYVLNKLWVYATKTGNARAFSFEMLRYILTRGFTFCVDYFGLTCCVEVFGLNEKIMKPIITVIVIVLNYILGKLIVFTKKNRPETVEKD